MDVQQLNMQFGLGGAVRFGPGPGGFTVAEIKTAQAAATVALYGGHVLTFQPQGAQPVLWLSPRARFEPGKPIRGGIPVCWPWFSAHPSDTTKPFHGFARIMPWQVAASGAGEGGRVWLRLRLTDSAATQALWPQRFGLELTVTVGPELGVELKTCNPGEIPFTITQALHSYLAVSAAADIGVTGLDGVDYLDKTDNQKRKRQRGTVRFEGETDRTYLGTTAECVITDPGWNRWLRVAKSGSRTTVVWNPWVERSRNLEDMGDGAYTGMVCVETANAADDTVVLQPGQEHRLVTAIRVDAV